VHKNKDIKGRNKYFILSSFLFLIKTLLFSEKFSQKEAPVNILYDHHHFILIYVTVGISEE
jgi:hypothetical protein